MDSLTHMVVGAALGVRLLNKKIGRWGALIGAFLNTFPDFDLLYSGLSDPRKYILYHRAHSHSLFFQLIYGFLIAAFFWWLVKKVRDKKNSTINAHNKLLKHRLALDPNSGGTKKNLLASIPFVQWLLFVLVCILSHSLMDMCTDYGTRWLLPFSEKVISLNTIAIADLTLTIPILLLVIIGISCKNNSIARNSFMNTAMIYTLVFFAFTFLNKASVDKVFKASLASQNISSYVKHSLKSVSITNIIFILFST